MPSAADRIDFGPPRDAGGVRSFGLALLIHALLIAALTWGVNWKRSDSAATFAAELWSGAPADAVPMAPVIQQATPVPVPVPVPEVSPTPAIEPDIALEQEKKRNRVKEQQAAQEKNEREQAKLKQAKAQALALTQTQAEQDKANTQKQKQNQNQKQAQQAADKQRSEQMKRMQEQIANASGSPAGASAGSTSRASAGGKGSSTTYGAIARAAIIPNVVFTEAFDGNPLTKVEVRLTLDGTIISSSVVQPSGNKNWDNAVLNAVSRTRVMPKDVDGKLPDTILILEFKPRF